MISANVDRSVVEQFREEIDTAIFDQKDKLVDRTTERAAGYIQGLRDARAILDSIIQNKNDARSRARNPQQENA